MKRDCKRRRAVSKGNLTANVYTPKILHDKSKDAEDFIVSLESSIESYPLQSRNEFVEELVYKGEERKKKNKGWREREEEKVRKKKKKRKRRALVAVCGIHIRFVFDDLFVQRAYDNESTSK